MKTGRKLLWVGGIEELRWRHKTTSARSMVELAQASRVEAGRAESREVPADHLQARERATEAVGLHAVEHPPVAGHGLTKRRQQVVAGAWTRRVVE